MGNAQGSAPKSDVLKHIELLEGKYKVPVVAFTPPKFEPGDPAALAYLDEHGYVVFGGAASPDEAKQSVDMFWTHLETETGGKIKRADPSTWIDENGFPGGGFGGVGIMTTMAIGHAAWLWHLRGLPRVVKAFETIWGTDDLLTSFDGGGVFRPPEINELWATRDGWFHVDQNWRHKPTRVSVQGLVNLLPSGPADGGLVVVPQSHKVFEILAKEQPDAAPSSNRDFVRMTERDIPELWARGAYKLCLAPGDLALWDSRTTHCNHPATRQLSRARQGQVELRRLVGYICMTPTSFAKDREAHIKRRVQGFQQAQTTTHWPHDYQATSAPYKSKTFALPALNDLQRQILVGKGSDIDVTKPIVVDRDP